MRGPMNYQPWRRRGVAVVTALLLTTLAVSIVASLFWQQQVQVRTMENQRLQLQTKWILRGALDWATLVLDTFRNAPYTSLDQAWATPLADTRLDQYIERERVEGESYDASLSGNITDASSRYNLRNLAENRTPLPEQVAIFRRLLSNLQLDQGLAQRVAQFVAAGQSVQANPDPGDGTAGSGSAGGGNNGSGDVRGVTGGIASGAGATGGSLGGNGVSGASGVPVKLLQVDDLLAVPGFTPAMVERLRPFVIVLPDRTPVNVNTAPPEVLAAVIPNMSVSEANTLVVRRKQAPWNDEAKFTSELGASRQIPQNSIGIKSEWFLINSRIRLDRAGLDAEALIRRPSGPMAGGSGTRVVWIRQY